MGGRCTVQDQLYSDWGSFFCPNKGQNKLILLCLPSVSVPEYNLTGEFCRKHFLTGLLLRELGLALQDEQDLRHLALATLKTLMAKHSLDARYATKVASTRVYTGGLVVGGGLCYCQA